MKKSWYAIRSSASQQETEISIFDEIGCWGVTAAQFIEEIKAIPPSNRIDLRIHSPGGSVFDGNVIYNVLRRHPAGVTVQIEGLAASMASVIALSGAPVKMAENGWFMIHNPECGVEGQSKHLRSKADLLDDIRASMISAYCHRTGATCEQVEEWMNEETWFTAAAAKEAGFVDEITDPIEVAANFSRLHSFRRTPANLTTAPHHMSEPTPATEEIPAVAPAEETIPPALAENEPATDPVSDPAVDPAAPAAPEAAVVPAADAIIARHNEVLARAERAEAELATVRAQLTAERAALERLERSLGVAPASVIPPIDPAAADKPDILETYMSMPAGAARQEFFRKHKAELRALQGGGGK